MQKIIINQQQAIQLLKAQKNLDNYEITFDSTPVEALDALLLRKNNIPVPQDLIFYDEESIDFSDDPGLTDEDIASGKIKWLVNAELALDQEVRSWIKEEHINLNALLTDLITVFYRNVKAVSKKVS
jgi:hypothetical protein